MMVRTSTLAALGAALVAGLGLPALAADTTPAQQLARFSTQAGAAGDAARGQRFFDGTHGGEWLRRNCNDVLKRECSAAEKADVMAYLNGFK